MKLLGVMKGFLFNNHKPLSAIYEESVYTIIIPYIDNINVEVYTPLN